MPPATDAPEGDVDAPVADAPQADGPETDVDAPPDARPDGQLPDVDGDGIPDATDACPNDPDNDADGDSMCGDVDVCPNDPDNDGDGDSICGDVDDCPNDRDNDADGDSICGDVDDCPNDPANDEDQDGLCADVDLCLGDNTTGDFDHNGICDGPFIVPTKVVHASLATADPQGTGPGIAWSPDGALVAAVHREPSGVVVLSAWENAYPDSMELADAVEIPDPSAPTQDLAIAWSPDTELIAVVGRKEILPGTFQPQLMLFSFGGELSLEALTELPGPGNLPLTQIAWSPETDLVGGQYSGGMWLTAFDEVVGDFRDPTLNVDTWGGLAFLPGETHAFVATATAPELKFANLEGEIELELKLAGNAYAVALFGDELLAASVGHAAHVYRVEDLLNLEVKPAVAAYDARESFRVGSVAWHPNGIHFVAAGNNFIHVMAYDREEHIVKTIQVIPKPASGGVHGVAISPDGDFLAVRHGQGFSVYEITTPLR